MSHDAVPEDSRPGPLDWGTDDGLPGLGWLLVGGVLGIAAGVVTVVWVPLGIYQSDPEPTDGMAGWVALGLAAAALVPLVLGSRGWLRASQEAKQYGHDLLPLGVVTLGMLGLSGPPAWCWGKTGAPRPADDQPRLDGLWCWVGV